MSKFVSDSFATNHVVMSFNNSYRAAIHFSTLDDSKYYEGGVPTTVTLFNKATDKLTSIELTKDQITHFLSLDCPDAFIAYALTLCPCLPETAKPALVAVDGGILDIVKQLKEIKENINLINATAFNNSTLTDAQHYQLLDVEMFIDDFIAPYSYREVIQ